MSAAMPLSTLEEYRLADAEAALEDDWIAEVERDPANVDWFVAVAEDLVAAGESERARGLLDLWDGELCVRGRWGLRLDFLRRAGALLHKPVKLHKEVVATLAALWAGKPNFASTLEWVGLRKVVEDPARLWDRVTRLGSVLLYDAGAVVAMKGQGVGRVVEVNLALETLKIDFDRKRGVTVGFRAAPKMLRILEPGHLLRRKLEDPEGLAKLRDERPAELLRAVLQAAEHPLTAGEIREALAGIVDDGQWTSWWAAARRHPQVVTLGSGRQSYRWEDSATGALDAVRQSFDRADPRRQIEIFRRNSERDAELGRELAGALASTASEAAAGEPALAWEIFFALERTGRLPESLAGLAERLVAPPADPRPLVAGITDRLLRERALAMIRERRDDWPSIFRDLLAREEDPRVLSTLADGLAVGDREGLERALDDVLAQPRRAPALFAWLAERAADDEALRARAPLRLLQQILSAFADEAGGQRVRLRPLLESGSTVPRLLAHLDEAQAAAALEAMRKCAALEAYQRDALGAALRLRFPSLDEAATIAPLYATPAAIALKREELQRLTEVEIPANRKAIEEARALGDLRENFEYKSARQRHEYLNARVATLHRDLQRARPIEFGRLDTSEVRIGARVELRGDDGAARRLSVLGPWDSRPEAGVVSYESELGQKLLGRRVGDEVNVGDSLLRVAGIAPAG
jgi:transcription elongation GreA/GreB family factor